MSDIVPSWLWRPPGEIIERLMGRSERARAVKVKERKVRDRYYTMSRRVHLKRLMRSADNRRGD